MRDCNISTNFVKKYKCGDTLNVLIMEIHTNRNGSVIINLWLLLDTIQLEGI